MALDCNTTGYCNTASGYNALYSNTGSNNTASGYDTLYSNTVGGNNTASGYQALYLNTGGFSNTASGAYALYFNTTGIANTASGYQALDGNATGQYNTASGYDALTSSSGNYNTASGAYALFNASGSYNTAVGYNANVGGGNLTNATAIGAGAIANASNKVRVGNDSVTVIAGHVGFTVDSDRNQKENFLPVDGETVLRKIRRLKLTSWNFIGHDPKQFRHYGPMAQDFFAAFGHDEVGTIGTDTTITSTDIDGILMIAAKALEKRTVEQEKEIAQLKARLEALERRGCEVAAARAAIY